MSVLDKLLDAVKLNDDYDEDDYLDDDLLDGDDDDFIDEVLPEILQKIRRG